MVVEVMTRKDRLRRVVILCCSFGRNLAYYRVGQSEHGKRMLESVSPTASFWLQANVNFLDCAVLEWCKLLGDKKGEHHWRRIVSDADRFETELLDRIGMSADAFNEWTVTIRRYRDKFVAHLDSDPVAIIPMLDAAKASVRFYHGYVVTQEAEKEYFAGLTATTRKFDLEYRQCFEEGERILGRAE